MSKSSIYETTWLDLVFEGKNKEYGAYQLRQENAKTTIKALITALVLFCFAIGVIMAISAFTGKAIPKPEFLSPTIHMTEIVEPILPPKQDQPKTNTPPPLATEDATSFKDPMVVKPEDATPDTPKNSDFPDSNASPTGIPGGTGTSEIPSNGGGNSPVVPEAPAGDGTYSTATVDKMPTYPGGMDNFYKYVGRHFQTPEVELTSGSTVKVMVSFVIEKDGTMTDIKVHRNPGYGLDKEAIRVLKSMKVKWDPGSIKGQPVRVVYNLPIAVKVP